MTAYQYLREVPQVGEVSTVFEAAGLNWPRNTVKLELMLQRAPLIVTARAKDGTLVGLIRVLTDFEFNAFIADLAVHPLEQRRGVGKELVRLAVSPWPNVKYVVSPGLNVHSFWEACGFQSLTGAVVRNRR